MKLLYKIIFLAFLFVGCSKDEGEHPCYDSSIVHDNPCTSNCPGFEGCDGKTYCNQCEAARLGIGPSN